MEEIKSVEIVNKETGEIIQTTPEDLVLAASDAAKVLERVIQLNDKPPLMFRGERYLEVPHWQTLAKFYHCTVSTSDPVFIEVDGVKGFKAKATVLDEKTGIIVGGAESFCMRDEKQWKDKPLFQLASMAQTRAMSKALSNKFRFVAIVAGYSGTPAEEMTEVIAQPQIKMPEERKPIEAEFSAAPPEVQAKKEAEDLQQKMRPPKSKFFARLHALVREKGIEPEKMKRLLAMYDCDSSKDLDDERCAALIRMIERGGVK